MKSYVRNFARKWKVQVEKEFKKQGIVSLPYFTTELGRAQRKKRDQDLKTKRFIWNQEVKEERARIRKLPEAQQESELLKLRERNIEKRKEFQEYQINDYYLYNEKQRNAQDRILIRLLNWRVWILRYAIPLPFIVETLLDRYSKVRYEGNDSRFPVSVNTLTSQKSHDLVLNRFRRMYPHHKQDLKQKRIDRIQNLDIVPKEPPPKPEEYLSTRTFQREYQKWIKFSQTKKRNIKVVRPYRTNPLLREHQIG